MITIFCVCALVSGVVSQYGFVRPDVMFGEQNDRFNIPDLYAADDINMRAREDQDSRRNVQSKIRYEEINGNEIPAFDEEMNMHHQLLSNREVLNQPSLRELLRLAKANTRRSQSAEQRTLFQNAFPLDFQIEGYLPLPDE